jgi:hypothetical protein
MYLGIHLFEHYRHNLIYKITNEIKNLVQVCKFLYRLRQQAVTLPGDVLIVSAFISYVGGFNRKYRSDLLNEAWLPFFKKLQVPKIAIILIFITFTFPASNPNHGGSGPIDTTDRRRANRRLEQRRPPQ